MQCQPVTGGDFFQGAQAGVVLYPQLIELVELVVQTTSLRRLLLRPMPTLAQFLDALAKLNMNNCTASHPTKVASL